jgi:Na+-translocating ferredoxin:NAD+ oxidoreductase RnfC subunit
MAAPYFRRLDPGLPPLRPGFQPESVHVGFVVDEVPLGQVFSEYSGFPVYLHSTNCSTVTIIYPLGLVK